MYNCPNCGAPITGSKCEYCGTVFSEEHDDSIKELNEKLRFATIELSLCEQRQNILNSIHPYFYDDIRQSTQASINDLNSMQCQNLRASTNIYPYVEPINYTKPKHGFWERLKNWWNMNGYLFGF